MPLLLATKVDAIPHLPPNQAPGIETQAYTVALTSEEGKSRKSLLKKNEKTGELEKMCVIL